MRRLFYVELKRVITTRSTWILLSLVILLSAVMAYFPISFVSTYYADEEGNVQQCKGVEAIARLKQQESNISGEITEEKIRQAITVFRECYRQYGSVFPPELPEEVYAERIVPIFPVLDMAAKVLTPDDVYLYTMTDADIFPEDASRFYEEYQRKMVEKGKDREEQEKIGKLSEKVSMPFTYVPGFSPESFDYLILYILIMMLVLVVLISPVFAAEYQTGADSILRCTKNGRMQLAITKIFVSVLIFAITFAIGTGAFLLITDLVFGMEGLETTVQMLNSVFVIPALTVGQTQGVTAAGGFLSLLATVSFTLYLSARCKNVQDALKIGILASLLPTILYMLSSANLADAVRCMLPSGGIGLMNSFLYELLEYNFAHIGPAVIWTPYLVAGAAAVEIPLFLFLAVRTYCRREAV